MYPPSLRYLSLQELEVELEELRLLVVAMVGREQGSCASSSGEGTVDDKVGKDTRDARESSPHPGRKLRGGKVTCHRETGRKETGRKGTGGKTTGVKERGVGETGGKEKGVGETGGKTTGVRERGVAETGGKEKGAVSSGDRREGDANPNAWLGEDSWVKTTIKLKHIGSHTQKCTCGRLRPPQLPSCIFLSCGHGSNFHAMILF